MGAILPHNVEKVAEIFPERKPRQAVHELLAKAQIIFDMNTKTFVISGVLLAALWGVTPKPSCAAIKPEDLAKVQAALPDKATATPAAARKVLIYTRANGFVHSSIDLGAEAVRLLGEKTGAYVGTVTDDPKAFEPDNLKQYDAVVFVSTTGDSLKPAGFDKLDDAGKKAAIANEDRYKAALMDFVRGGKGWMGIHAATDSYYGWGDYGKMTGAYFDGHPWHEKVGVHNEDPTSPVTAALEGKDFEITDEIYQYRDYDRKNQRVLLGLDVTKTNMKKGGIKRNDGDFAVSWIKNIGQGRLFYCSLGHREEIYWNPMMLKYYLAGLQFALGDLKADAASLPMPEMMRKEWRAMLMAPGDPEDVKDDINGVYTGTFVPANQTNVPATPTQVKVVAWGPNEYRAVVELPDGDKTRRVEVPLRKGNDGKITADGNAGGANWTGNLENGKLTLAGGGDFTVNREAKSSPTQGLKAPANAIVLLSNEPGKYPVLDEWREGTWKPISDGSMQTNATGDQHTKREFGDIVLHLEYKPPVKPEARDQERGNSGVYFQDRYEMQVLDSFGWPAADNQSGGIYHVAVPKVNAALPPTEWQTYDIAFRAPRFNADGSVKIPATVTAYLNGVLIHDNVAIPGPTGGGAPGNVAKGVLRLQDHNNPVRFRNIWVVERNFADDAPLPSPVETK